MSRKGALIAEGRTSDVYEFGRGSVVKVPRPTVPRHWAAAEAEITAAVRAVGAPAPEMIDVVQIAGRDAIVFERVGGRSMWELILEQPLTASRWGGELADVHRGILAAGVPRRVLGIVERMRAKITSTVQLSDAERREALEALERLPRGAALLHGDLHPGNVLMSPCGPVVIDWFDAAVGHPVADAVRSSVLIRPFGARAVKPHLPDADPAMLEELHDSYVSAMSELFDRPVDELRAWETVVAVSRLAEDAEVDESPLLALWHERHTPWRSPLSTARASSVDQRSK